MDNKNPDSNALILHFFGDKEEALAWSDHYVGGRDERHGTHPYSFLAKNGFDVINDKFFVKKYFKSRHKNK